MKYLFVLLTGLVIFPTGASSSEEIRVNFEVLGKGFKTEVIYPESLHGKGDRVAAPIHRILQYNLCAHEGKVPREINSFKGVSFSDTIFLCDVRTDDDPIRRRQDLMGQCCHDSQILSNVQRQLCEELEEKDGSLGP